MDKNSRTLSLAQKNKQKRNDGIRFFYSDGKISRISEWKERRKELFIRIELLLTEVDREMDVPKAISLLCAFCNKNTIGFDFC